ncbi:MAG: CBS domain-containing protein [Rhodocyclaceae bacterium]|jgi:CBS domain-containing protein|nr:CBS domain-containing protein [Rhodocyclaceae bacterium]MCL4681825.1 CBS domain-containing protein [Rhodocyclaceae bacterium]
MEEANRQTAKGEFQAMYSPLGSLIRRKPETVPLDATVRQAIRVMDEKRIGSIIVADEGGRLPLGIFTLRDLLHRVALPGCTLDLPIASVMTAGVITVKPQTTAYQAALIMGRRGLRHLLVVDDAGSLLGIVSQNDLFALQRTGVNDVTGNIREAKDLAALQSCSRDIRSMADAMLRQGVAADQLTHLISTLNDLLTLRIIELTHDEFDLPQVRWCWIALGSEGRYEQTLSTDQDNGIIFDADGEDAGRIRETLLPFASAVNNKLDACGFPLCKGGIMAGNPEWCLSLEEWRGRFSKWIQMPEPKALLNASIFFDFRPLYGDEDLSHDLREWLLGISGKATLFLRLMSENALQCAPPLGMIRDFVYDNNKDFPHTIDLKMYGSRPFVDAARIFALANNVAMTGTAQRLRGAAEATNLGADVEAMIDGFYFIQLLRLRHQQDLSDGNGGANRIDPDKLNELDRHILKEAFKQARKLQDKLRLDYRL